MVIQLAENYYGDEDIFEDLIEANAGITAFSEDDTWTIEVPATENMDVNLDKLAIRPKSVEALALLDSGDIDYAFEYRSVAEQHGLSYVDLPAKIDLSSADEAENYSSVRIKLADGQINIAKPIVYGFTIPTCAEVPELAQEFAALMLSIDGRGVFEDNFQPPIVPAKTDNQEAVPDFLKPYL